MQSRYEVISVSDARYAGDFVIRRVKLLHKPKPERPEPWWHYPAGMEVAVPPDMEINPGDFLTLTVAKEV